MPFTFVFSFIKIKHLMVLNYKEEMGIMDKDQGSPSLKCLLQSANGALN